jgi:hypothetical protein
LRRLPAPRRRHKVRWEEKRWEKEGADRPGPHGSETRRGLVVGGPAGCVGPKGPAAWLFVQGWGERRGFGRPLLVWLRPKVAGKVFLFCYHLSSYLNYDLNLN